MSNLNPTYTSAFTSRVQQKVAQEDAAGLRQALLLTALGGTAGAATSLFSNDEEDRKQWLTRAIMGAGLGAGTGGLVHVFNKTAPDVAGPAAAAPAKSVKQQAKELTDSMITPEAEAAMQEMQRAETRKAAAKYLANEAGHEMGRFSFKHPLTMLTGASRGAKHITHAGRQVRHNLMQSAVTARNAQDVARTPAADNAALNQRIAQRGRKLDDNAISLSRSRPKKKLTAAALAAAYLADRVASNALPTDFKENSLFY